MPILLLLAACQTSPVEVVRAPSPPLTGEGGVLRATVTRAPGEVPARFGAPPETWVEGPGPPIGRIRRALCVGEPGVREAVRAGLAAAPPDRASAWPGVDTGCTTPDWCAWLGETLAADPANPAFDALWWATPACDDPTTTALVSRSGPPDVVVAHAARTGRYDPRLEAIASLLLTEPSSALDWVLSVIADCDEPAAEQALVALHRRAARPVREAVALSMWGRFGPEATALFRDACRGSAGDERCARTRPDRLGDASGAIQRGELDPDALVARFPNHRGVAVAALEDCARNGYDTCLVALAREDRDAASKLATELQIGGPLGKVLGASRAQVLADLAALGFPPLGVPDDSDAVTVPELFAAAGQAVRVSASFDWPPHHEQLLYGLAAVAGAPELSFDELAPSVDAPEIEGRGRWLTLYAWADGWRWRTLLSNEEGWNAPSAAGFLNAVLAERDAPQRLAVDDEQRYVIAGTPEALASLASEGWVAFQEVEPPEEGYTVTPTAGPPVTLEPDP